MKKFIFLLSLLLASAGVTANAQSFTAKAFKSLGNAVTDVNALQNGAYYAFKCNSKGKFIKIENPDGNKHFANDNALTEADVTDALAVFKLHKVGDKYQFETALSGFYIPALNNNQPANASTTAGTFTIGKTDLHKDTKTDAELFAITGDNSVGFDMQNEQFVGWNAGGNQAWYKIYPVTVGEDVTCYKISYSLKKGDEVLASGNDGWYKNGSTYNGKSFVKSSFYNIICSNPNMVVSETNKHFTYVATTKGTVPFTTNKWYRMQTRFNNPAYKDNSYVTVGTYNGAAFVRGNGSKDMSTYADVVNGLWRFEESGLGVKLFNLGTGKYLKNGSVSTVDNDGTVFYVNEPGQASNVQFTLSVDNGAYFGNHSSVYQDATNNNRNAAMSTWDSSDGAKKDDGSNFTIYDVDADFMTSAKAALTNTLTMNTAESKFVSNGVVTTAYDAVKAKVDNATTLDQLKDLFNEAVAATPATTITPDENAYYRLKIADTYITTEAINVGKDGKLSTAYNANHNINRVVSRSDANSALVPQIWQFVKVGNSYALCNVNNHCRCAFFANNNLDMPIDENYTTATATIKPVLSTATNDNSLVSLTLTGGNQVFGLRGVKDNSNVNRFIGTNIYSANEPANIWQIEKVTTVPVSITDAKYATVAFPFATKVTGVKAYYATDAANGIITLVEYPEGIIPANQGALLYNEAGATTANLEIVTNEKSVEGNKLLPATAKRTGFAANSTYVLAKNRDNEAAFLKNGLTVVPANKAYIDAETIPTNTNSNELNFNFGQTTGINGVVAADKAGVQYFDLQGRRVLYPAHGIFVTNTGKKVFVK